jgi:RNase P subunit RPR2
MKIIKHGVKPSDRKREINCTKCESIIEVQRSEGTLTYDQRDGDFITFVCPVCGNKIHVAANLF